MMIKPADFSTVNRLNVQNDVQKKSLDTKSSPSFKGYDSDTIDNYNCNIVSDNPHAYASMLGIFPSAHIAFEHKINKIYDDIFPDVLKQNPIIKELNYQKPKLKIADDMEQGLTPEGVNRNAYYDFRTNSITLSPDLAGNAYAIFYTDSSGEEVASGIVSENKFLDIMEKYNGRGNKIRYYRFTEDEKDTYIATIIAHELRHSIQEHMLSSLEGLWEERKAHNAEVVQSFKDKLQESEEMLSKLPEDVRIIGKLQVKPMTDKIKKTIKESQYSINYQPKKVLPQDTLLKFSTDEDDNRYWSLKDHMTNYKYGNKTVKEYTALPQEIDAHNYVCDFLYTQVPKKIDSVRDDVWMALFCDSANAAEYGLKNMAEFGYPPLIEK